MPHLPLDAVNVSVKYEDGKYINAIQEVGSSRLFFIEGKRDITLIVNGNEQPVHLENMDVDFKLGTNKVKLIFKEDTLSEAIEDSLVTPRR
ncbi:unnamed protein product [Rhizophagus irregularis]|nr:unnamed protein product [Rhizophagus irregularis]CAB5364995.1 unnamed protein product [Rhizophagus irregularis]